MISSKFILSGICGLGITAGGLAALQLTKNNKQAKNLNPSKHESNQYAEKRKLSSLYETEVDTTCGEDIWYNSQNSKKHDELNSKQNNSDDYLECIKKIRFAHNK